MARTCERSETAGEHSGCSLAFSPRWTFFRPGLALLGGWHAWLCPRASARSVFLGAAHWTSIRCLVASLLMLMGWQCVLLAALAQIFTGREGMMPPHEKLEEVTVEHGLVFGITTAVLGLLFVGLVAFRWWQNRFGPLDYPQTMRWVVPGVTLVAIGFQTAMASLMGGVLKMQRSRRLSLSHGKSQAGELKQEESI